MLLHLLSYLGATRVIQRLCYDDIYFNNENGLEESKYVFLQHNQLTKRFFFNSDTQTLTLAETGFGTGLNFLLTLHAFRQAKAEHAPIKRLHFISIEKHPLVLEDLKKALARWPSLREEADLLLSNYPKLMSGCHRCHFLGGQVTLDLWFGDVKDCLTSMHTSIWDHRWLVPRWFRTQQKPRYVV